MSSAPRPAPLPALLALLAALGVGAAAGGCGGQAVAPVELEESFEAGTGGWVAAFADLPVEPGPTFELGAGVAPLPAPLEGAQHGFFLQGHNRSDDLFMFITRRLTERDGVRPRQHYLLRVELDVVSTAPSGCGGIGGAPGESVVLKVGATPKVAEALDVVQGAWRTAFDKGNQSRTGADASLAGTLASGLPCPDATPVRLSRAVDHPTPVQADAAGGLSVFVGTDSGFEGLTRVGYDAVRVRLTPVPAP
jgi:hypothetical protein